MIRIAHVLYTFDVKVFILVCTHVDYGETPYSIIKVKEKT